MRPIGRAIGRWRRSHAADGRLALVTTYPHYLYLRDMVRPDHHVYYNIDDYTLYWPRHAREVERLECQTVREADLTVCVSRLRANELRARVPEASARIHHLPHGAPSATLAEHPWERPAPAPNDLADLPRPLLGYIGSLEDRLDWPLLTGLSKALPHASIVLIGRPAVEQAGDWYAEYRECLARPNVHAIGWRPQEAIHRYHRAFDVCLIPYQTAHPFNRACSPTKIMDCMGTGRPIVSSALPECQLYDHLFHVAASHDHFITAVRSIVDAESNDGRAHQRFAWAHANSCENVVHRLLSWIPD